MITTLEEKERAPLLMPSGWIQHSKLSTWEEWSPLSFVFVFSSDHIHKVTSIGDEGVCAIADALKKNSSVTKLALDWWNCFMLIIRSHHNHSKNPKQNNKYGDKGAKALAELLRVNSKITEIWVGFSFPSLFLISFFITYIHITISLVLKGKKLWRIEWETNRSFAFKCDDGDDLDLLMLVVSCDSLKQSPNEQSFQNTPTG